MKPVAGNFSIRKLCGVILDHKLVPMQWKRYRREPPELGQYKEDSLRGRATQGGHWSRVHAAVPNTSQQTAQQAGGKLNSAHSALPLPSREVRNSLYDALSVSTARRSGVG
jgi:hypothetical protein